MKKKISLSEDVFERLSKYGKFGQDADDLINELLNKIDKVE